MSETKARLHCKIWQCPVCKTYYNHDEISPILVGELFNLDIVGAGTIRAATKITMLDEQCFKNLGLKEDEPKIIMPNTGIITGS